MLDSRLEASHSPIKDVKAAVMLRKFPIDRIEAAVVFDELRFSRIKAAVNRIEPHAYRIAEI